MDVSQLGRFLPPLIVSNGKEKEARVKNRHEELRLIRVLEQLQIQEKVYLQEFQREKQVVEGRRVKFCNRVKSFSLGHVPATEGRCCAKLAPEEESCVTLGGCPKSIPRSISMPSALPMWSNEDPTKFQLVGQILEELPDVGHSESVGDARKTSARCHVTAGQSYLMPKRNRKLSQPIKEVVASKFDEGCSEESFSSVSQEGSDQKHAKHVERNFFSHLHIEKIRNRPASALGHNLSSTNNDGKRPTASSYAADSIKSHRPSSAIGSKTEEREAEDERPASATDHNLTSEAQSERLLRSLSAHDIPTTLKSSPRGKKILISANEESVSGSVEKGRRRSSTRRNSLRVRPRKNSFFDAQLSLKQELKTLELKRTKRRMSTSFTIDDAITAEKVSYSNCVHKLENFFSRMTEFNACSW